MGILSEAENPLLNDTNGHPADLAKRLRTRVAGLKAQRPRPLDDGDFLFAL